ncbi:hypothetical protein JOM56_012272 [Amanita muscaria]
MPTKPVVRASPVSHGLFYGLTVDPLEDTTVPSSPVALPVTTSSFSAKKTPFSYAASILHDVFMKNNTDFDRAQALYKVFIEMASELETTSHFYAVMTRIADNLATLGCKTKPCTQHCDRSHCEPCTLEHASPCMLPHAEPCTLSHAAPCALPHAEPCVLPHFFVTPEPCPLPHNEPCPLPHNEPCKVLHIDPCALSHAEPCTLAHNEPCQLTHAEKCTLNHFPLEPERVAIPIPCPLAHNDLCKREHISHSPTLTPMDVVPTDTALPLIASLPTASPTLPDDQIKRKQLKRKQFKQRKLIKKMTRYHENEVLDRSHNNSDYELDSDGFCRDPLAKQDFAHMKREFDKEDDEKYEDTLRAFMDIAEDSDFLADKPPPQNSPKFVVYPSTKKTPARQESSIPPAASPSASLSLSLIPPTTTSPIASLPVPKVVLPRSTSAPPPSTDNVKHSLPTRAHTAPPEVSRNTLTARRCTTQGPNPSSFVKFLDVPVTLSREDITKSLKENNRWIMVDISNMEIFAMKNNDASITNDLKIKVKDDEQSNTVKKLLTTSISFGHLTRRCRPWYLSTRSQ